MGEIRGLLCAALPLCLCYSGDARSARPQFPPEAKSAVLARSSVDWIIDAPGVSAALLDRHATILNGTKRDRESLARAFRDLTDDLRGSGHPVAQAGIMPADLEQYLSGGTLRVTIRVGKVARVRVKDNKTRVSTAVLEARAQNALCPDGSGEDCVLTARRLERMMLLLRDMPGVDPAPPRLNPELAPEGQTYVDLVLQPAQAQRAIAGRITANNYGFPASGSLQSGVGMTLSNLAARGEVVSLAGNVSVRGTWTGSAGFSLPLGARGLKLDGAYGRSQFSLGAVDAVLDADMVEAGLTYPVRRGFDENLTIGAQTYWSRSKQAIAGLSAYPARTLKGLRATLRADSGEQSLAPDAHYRSISLVYSYGKVSQAIDPRNDPSGVLGTYQKVHLTGIARAPLQRGKTVVLASLQAQLASRNLDGQEKLLAGGPGAVRAYSVDEGSFDDGAVARLEVRRIVPVPDAGRISPGIIVDVASGRFTHAPAGQGAQASRRTRSRTYAGAGVAIDYQLRSGLSLGLVYAHVLTSASTSAGLPTARARAWLSAALTF